MYLANRHKHTFTNRKQHQTNISLKNQLALLFITNYLDILIDLVNGYRLTARAQLNFDFVDNRNK